MAVPKPVAWVGWGAVGLTMAGAGTVAIALIATATIGVAETAGAVVVVVPEAGPGAFEDGQKNAREYLQQRTEERGAEQAPERGNR